jgi:YHS domain-containing protein
LSDPLYKSAKQKMSLTNRDFIMAGFVLFALILPVQARDQGEEAFKPMPSPLGTTEYFSTDERTALALDGFDPVSYFLPEGLQPGKPEYQASWGGVAWRFSSAANRQAFLDAPEVYAPRYGGFDTEAMTRKKLSSANPTLYALKGGALYLFRNAASKEAFLKHPQSFSDAEKGWLEVKKDLLSFGSEG